MAVKIVSKMDVIVNSLVSTSIRIHEPDAPYAIEV